MTPVISKNLERWHFTVNGVVQGVGFRPFVYGLAQGLHLDGWVRNTTQGVEMVLQGQENDLKSFLQNLKTQAPPLAKVMAIDLLAMPVDDALSPGFHICDSHATSGQTLISPDVATCSVCLAEIANPQDRRYHYPFGNCTHCGPRFTIVQELPYDRLRTTMREFPLCADCAKEYGNASDRRFHAQPIACPTCGPTIWYEEKGRWPETQAPRGYDAIRAVVEKLNVAGIVAIRGMGGFHLCCRADCVEAVNRLRKTKFRPSKPLAVMVQDVAQAQCYCHVSCMAANLLMSPEAPIVLLRKSGKVLPDSIAPQNAYLGMMLPYTPLHHLLMAEAQGPLVMTSGNPAGEPLCKNNDEAIERLSAFVDGFLFHNRPIQRRCDDSVMMVVETKNKAVLQPVRRSRGLVPLPVILPDHLSLTKPVLSVGADLKNTSAVASGRQVFLTAHIGDLRALSVQEEQRCALSDLERLFQIKPEVIVCDLHPGYASTHFAHREAAQRDLPVMYVQHHHAHIAGCMAENGSVDSCIGLAFDGTGYGTDGHIWGGEVLLSDIADFERCLHLEYLPLPGGDAAIQNPYRTAIAYLFRLMPQADISAIFPEVSPSEIRLIGQMVAQNVQVFQTSSAGRLFDAVSALVGCCRKVSHEGQAAIVLENEALLAEEKGDAYPFAIDKNLVKLEGVIQGVVSDIYSGELKSVIARRFHVTLAEMALSAAKQVQMRTGVKKVALSGGVWQNQVLLSLTLSRLETWGFEVLLHHSVPANDGGIAFGQVAVAAARMQKAAFAGGCHVFGRSGKN